MLDSLSSKILVVDDEPNLRELLVDALRDLDVEIETAGNSREAIDLAMNTLPDIVVTDIGLGSDNGLELIDELRSMDKDLPAVIITGQGTPQVFSEALQRRPVEVMTKPLNIERLRETIRHELHRKDKTQRQQQRTQKLRKLARKKNIELKKASQNLDTTCEDLTNAYQTLSGQLGIQKVIMEYQQELLAAQNDDDIFRNLFRLFASRTGQVFGVAMVCDAEAQLQVAGRFGVPYPDNSEFTNALMAPLIDAVLVDPQVLMLDAGDEAELFDESIRRYLPGVTVLVIPLIPTPGELIGAIVLYRKGEQPFTDADLALADLAASPTATAVLRNG